MDTTIVSAMAGVFGSLIGGSATVATTWVSQRGRNKHKFIQTEIAKRENLYGEFIKVCSAKTVDAFERTLEKPQVLLPIYELLNRIRLCASDTVLHEAEQTLLRIEEQYFLPNLSLEQLREVVRNGANVDPLRSFAEACREELKSLLSAGKLVR